MIPKRSLARLQNLQELLWNTKIFKARITVGFPPLQAQILRDGVSFTVRTRVQEPKSREIRLVDWPQSQGRRATKTVGQTWDCVCALVVKATVFTHTEVLSLIPFLAAIRAPSNISSCHQLFLIIVFEGTAAAMAELRGQGSTATML